jgi:hypothetical protein
MAKPNLSVLFGTILLVAGLRMMKGPFYPNVEPIMLFTIVTALAYGPRAGGILGAGSLIVSDIMMGLPGPWTLYTGLSYGAIGVVAGLLGVWKRSWKREELAAVAFVATISYDAVTSTFWGLQTMQPLLVVYAAQVPFTLLHLSNCALAYVFAPEMMKALDYAKDFSLQKFLKELRLIA